MQRGVSNLVEAGLSQLVTGTQPQVTQQYQILGDVSQRDFRDRGPGQIEARELKLIDLLEIFILQILSNTFR